MEETKSQMRTSNLQKKIRPDLIISMLVCTYTDEHGKRGLLIILSPVSGHVTLYFYSPCSLISDPNPNPHGLK